MNVPITDKDAERALLGTFLMYPNSFAECAEFLNSDSFSTAECVNLYKALADHHSSGKPPDIMSIMQWHAENHIGLNPALLFTIQSEAGAQGQAVDRALYLRELGIRRRMWQIGNTLMMQGSTIGDDINEVYESSRAALDECMTMPGENVVTLADATSQMMMVVDANRKGESAAIDTPTGFAQIDRTGGLHPTDLIVIAGDTSQGKSALALTLSRNAILNGHPVAYFSLEMSNVQLAARMSAAISGVNSSDILYTPLDDSRYKALAQSLAETGEANELLYFDDTATSSLDSILASIRSMHKRYELKGAVVDYLQILNVNADRGTSTEMMMGIAARKLKNLAKELGIWIVALSQLSRDKDNPVPTLARLRSSGQISEAADTVILIYRPSTYGRSFPPPFERCAVEGKAMLDIAKGRNTGLAKFIVGFNPKTTSFYPASDSEEAAGASLDSLLPF